MFADGYHLSVAGKLLQNEKLNSAYLFSYLAGQLKVRELDNTQYVKAEFMGCHCLILKSTNKMQFKSTWRDEGVQ